MAKFFKITYAFNDSARPITTYMPAPNRREAVRLFVRLYAQPWQGRCRMVSCVPA